METIEIQIKNEHFRKSSGYIFDDCPLYLAIKERFPEAFISVGGKTVIIIYDIAVDKNAIVYDMSDNYRADKVDQYIEIAKSEAIKGEVWSLQPEASMKVILTYNKKQENLFSHEPKEDYIQKKDSQEETNLPEDLFKS